MKVVEGDGVSDVQQIYQTACLQVTAFTDLFWIEGIDKFLCHGFLADEAIPIQNEKSIKIRKWKSQSKSTNEKEIPITKCNLAKLGDGLGESPTVMVVETKNKKQN